MIDRYSRQEMAAVWSEATKFSHWLDIEILAVEARVERGDVPLKRWTLPSVQNTIPREVQLVERALKHGELNAVSSRTRRRGSSSPSIRPKISVPHVLR